MLVVCLSVPSAVGGGIASIVSLATRGEVHQQTVDAIKASQCIQVSCQSPAEIALVNELISRLKTAYNQASIAQITLLCASLTTNSAATPTIAAADAMRKYCGVSPGN